MRAIGRKAWRRGERGAGEVTDRAWLLHPAGADTGAAPDWRVPYSNVRGFMRRHLRLPTALLLAAFSTASVACARQVEVRTGESPTAASATSIAFTNNLAQAVNVYVRPGGGGELFVRQVAAKTTETLAVRGVSTSTSVTLRAAPVDGSVSYTRENVTLGGGYTWRVP